MKIVFISNYYNHHQSSLSRELYRQTEGDYCFIETEPMSQERINMGWASNESDSFVLQYYNQEMADLCNRKINEADAVIYGSAPRFLIEKRLQENKLVLFYSERWYKNGFNCFKLPFRIVKHHFTYGRYKNAYMLCSSAFSAYDCSRTLLFRNKTYKWGYFPEAEELDIDNVIYNKRRNEILWCARLIEFKHPELPLMIAKVLKRDRIDYHLSIIGNGPMEDELKTFVAKENLTDFVSFLGNMNPVDVREYMKKASVFLFTSDKREGWGAVLNESMNSGCAVIASSAIGSVPFLIDNMKNGIVYKDGDFEDLYKKTKVVISNKAEAERLGRNAYYSVVNMWNNKNAAARLMKLVEDLLSKHVSNTFNEGPCSKASIIKDNWFDKSNYQ